MWRASALAVVLALPAKAEAPDTSLFPRARPAPVETVIATSDAQIAPAEVAAAAALAAVSAAEAEAVAAAEAAIAAATLASSPFPRARPDIGSAADDATSEVSAPADRRPLLGGLFAPRPRPDRDVAAAAPRGNGICGNPALTGVSIERISSRTNGCGVEEPVQISAVDGIQLSIPATMDCPTANALAQWVDQGLQPAFDNQVVGIQVAGHYICRTRNHRPGARISEHGRGKAIDISGIVLADGAVLTVSDNWNRAMRRAYQAGCGIFGTTLGPGSDGYHENHMHFDTANHRNGPYCR